MTTRYYQTTECEHGNDGICDHIPNETRDGGCLRLDCEVLHDDPCPGGQRRELTGVEVVKAWPYEDTACIHMHILPAGRYAIITLEELADG